MAEIEQTDDHSEKGYIKDEEGRLVPDYDQTIKIFDDGDIVSGTVVRVDKDEILVDIGYKSEGVIPIRELSVRKDANPSDIVGVGDEIDALVLQKEDKDGRLILSKKRAEYEKSWGRIEELSHAGEPVTGVAIEVVKGGLIVDIGLRGFLPASLVDVRRVKDLSQFLRQELECKVIEMDRNRNNVVLSRRAVLDEARKHEREKILTGLEKGQVLDGKVSSIVDFGAFVDLGGLDGLIHISELSWTHIDHPSDVLNLGDDVKVKVLDIDMERGRISLGLKQTQEDPWKQKLAGCKVGDVIEGEVTKLVPFGAFVALMEGIEGLVHISELAEEHVEAPEQAVKAGETVKARIVDIDYDRRRISLSLRQAVSKRKKTKAAAEAPVAEETAAPATDVPVAEETAAPATDVPVAEETAAPATDVPAADVAEEPIPPEAPIPEEPILESGETASIIEAIAATASPPLDISTDELLEAAASPATEPLETEPEPEEQAPGEAGSLEQVLEQMKQTRGGKKAKQ